MEGVWLYSAQPSWRNRGHFKEEDEPEPEPFDPTKEEESSDGEVSNV
jgi:hypothetical protein